MQDPQRPPSEEASGTRRQRWLRRGWVVAFLLLLVLVLRTFVVGIYRVDSGSMAPLIYGEAQGGERVLVRYDRHPPLSRFGLVVFLRQYRLIRRRAHFN